MSSLQSAKQIDDEAADWAARVDGRQMDVDKDTDLQTWLAGDPRRVGAFLRAQAAINFLDRARALAGAETPSARPRVTRRWMLLSGSGALAASLGGVALWRAQGQRRFNTGLGEIRRLPLADGSVAVINTATVLDVALKPREREIRLRRGEAWFQVAKDASRPFVVLAGSVRVRAVGTAFSVRRRAEGVEVMVTEGVVETWIEGEAKPHTRLLAGDRIALAGPTPPLVAQTPSEIDRSLAWRNGEIALDGETLSAAAEQFNRYNTRQIVIDDADLARERFVGLFRTNDPDSFAVAASATIGARVTHDGEVIRLSRNH